MRIRVADDGITDPPAVPAVQPSPPAKRPGHGIEGMRERAALHHGALQAGPAGDGGWLVEATLRPRVAGLNGAVPV